MTTFEDADTEAADAPLPTSSPAHHVPEVEALLEEAVRLVDAARPMPLSTSSIINREDVLDLLMRVSDALPEEVRGARWLLRERDEYLQRVRQEGDEILSVARTQAERMVERTEVVKAAEHRAQRLISDAEAESRLMRRQTEDFCDARLASLEGILDRTRSVVVTGRHRLQGLDPRADSIDLTDEIEAADIEPTAPLFDQDFS